MAKQRDDGKREPAFLLWLTAGERAVVEQAAGLLGLRPTPWCREQVVHAALTASGMRHVMLSEAQAAAVAAALERVAP